MNTPKTMSALLIASADTKENWENFPHPISPPGMWLYEKDTTRIKMSDGISMYTDLPYRESLTVTQKDTITKACMPGGVLVLGNDGRIGKQYLPQQLNHVPMSIVKCKMLPSIPAPFHDLQIPAFLARGRFVPTSLTDTVATYAMASSAAYQWSAIRFPTTPGVLFKTVQLDVRAHGNTTVEIQFFNEHDDASYDSGNLTSPIGESVAHTFSTNGINAIDVSDLSIYGDGSPIWMKMTYTSGSGVSLYTSNDTNQFGIISKRVDSTNIANFRAALEQQHGLLDEQHVVVVSTEDEPLVVSFPITSADPKRLEFFLSIQIPDRDGTHWLYLDRDPVTDQISLGSIFSPLSTGCRRRQIDGSQFAVSSNRSLLGGDLSYLTDAYLNNGLPYSSSGRYALWSTNSTEPSLIFTGKFDTTLKSLRIASPKSRNILPKGWTLYGSPDGISWEYICTSPVLTSNDWIGDQMYIETDIPDNLSVFRDYRIDFQGFASGNVLLSEVELIAELAGDLYIEPQRLVVDRFGMIRDRVYIGKVIRRDGLNTQLIPFHPGVETYVPVNDGLSVTAGSYYQTHNPFGTDVSFDVQIFCRPNTTVGYDWYDELPGTASNKGQKDTLIDADLLSFTYGSKGSFYSTNIGKMRLRVSRKPR